MLDVVGIQYSSTWRDVQVKGGEGRREEEEEDEGREDIVKSGNWEV